jgi:gluconate:H+ symporter, GntP family
MDPLLLLLIGMVIVIGGILWLRLHAFVALLAAAVTVAVLTPRAAIERHALAQGATVEAAAAQAQMPLGAKLARSFGTTSTQLGLLIAMASIVGVALLASGGAERIVRSTLGWFGEPRAPLVFGLSGFLLGIPMFFDTVFLLLIPLARAMAVRTGRNYLLYVLAIAAGTTMTHSLVPPTPGPLFVAHALGVDLGLMMVAGLLLGCATASIGLLYAWWANRRWPAVPADGFAGAAPALARLDHEMPPLWVALLPIVIPVGLISGQTISQAVAAESAFAGVMRQIGHPNIALALAALVALATLLWQRRGDRTAVRAQVQTALGDAGMIILVTAAGGIFGAMLQETGVGLRIQELATEYRIAVLPLAFLVTALVRIGQGSATVAMVTSVGILSGFASAGTLGFHPVYLALVIGCGSKPIPWMNDSGFWLICKMSGLRESETLRGFSVMNTLMGLAGFGLVVIAAWFFPLV